MLRDAWALLSGSLRDDEFYRKLEADAHGFMYLVPKRGWSHRAGKLISALVQAGALLASFALLMAILAATTIQPVTL